ncbi:MAG TPA: DegQ family serine endoprotease, partial [Chromatiales bacterium]|nr:DegQ family serine endoprotease [Chromatiales bacterium]
MYVNNLNHWYRSLLALSVAVLFSSTALAASLPDFTQLVEDYGAAVVNISTSQHVQSKRQRQLPEGLEMPELPEGSPFGELFRHFFGEGGQGGGSVPPRRDSKSLGSGFIVSKDGYVVTNNHVVENADEIIVRLSDRRELQAKLIGTDPRSDIALLKIDADDLPTVKLGKDNDLKVGEWVLAIGSPFGFDHSVTAGIVSAKGRSLPKDNYVPFIQTDVAINPGNSGGPLFNLDGEVVGVNSQIYSRSGGFMGLSFAIPIDLAMNVVEQLKSEGHVTRGWLGVFIQDVTRELAESFGLDKPRGALVAKILPDSPAANSDLKVGDVILKFDGNDVTTSSSLPPLVGSSEVGVKLHVKVMRQGKKHKVQVVLGELPSDDSAIIPASQIQEIDPGRLGLTYSDLNEQQRLNLEIGSGGVIIDSVTTGPAGNAGLKKGDVVLM